MIKQQILFADGGYAALDDWLRDNGIERFLLVCGASMRQLAIHDYFEGLTRRTGITFVCFSDFQPNPVYESVVEGVRIFDRERCQAIVAVGGGSAMDVAKCIKLYCHMDHDKDYWGQQIVSNDVKLLAVPTTAGTGAEATRFAVIYYQGAKQSVTHDSAIPSAVLMDSSALQSLPLYQRKSTMLDALSHAVESFWSVNSTAESKDYSREALAQIMANGQGYLANQPDANAAMLHASYLAGKAINIAQTTAGHAMCYRLTSLYGLAHGHAAALCNRVLFPWMLHHTDDCIDPRGEDYLRQTFDEIAQAMGCRTAEEAAGKFVSIVAGLQMEIPKAAEEDYAVLKTSVNPTRLKNHPIRLDEDTLERLYRDILR